MAKGTERKRSELKQPQRTMRFEPDLAGGAIALPAPGVGLPAFPFPAAKWGLVTTSGLILRRLLGGFIFFLNPSDLADGTLRWHLRDYMGPPLPPFQIPLEQLATIVGKILVDARLPDKFKLEIERGRFYSRPLMPFIDNLPAIFPPPQRVKKSMNSVERSGYVPRLDLSQPRFRPLTVAERNLFIERNMANIEVPVAPTYLPPATFPYVGLPPSPATYYRWSWNGQRMERTFDNLGYNAAVHAHHIAVQHATIRYQAEARAVQQANAAAEAAFLSNVEAYEAARNRAIALSAAAHVELPSIQSTPNPLAAAEPQPSDFGETIVDVQIGVPQIVALAASTSPRPTRFQLRRGPRRKKREKKHQGKASHARAIALAWRQLNRLGETVEMYFMALDALESTSMYRPRYEDGLAVTNYYDGERGLWVTKPLDARAAHTLYQRDALSFNWDRFARSVVLNEIEDKAIGVLGRGVGDFSNRLGRPLGIQSGPAL